jgi:hypothetical protein
MSDKLIGNVILVLTGALFVMMIDTLLRMP